MKLPPRGRRRRRAGVGGNPGRAGYDTNHCPLPVAPRRPATRRGTRDSGACDIRGLPGYAPGVLALPLAAALSLAGEKMRGLAELPGTTIAIVVESSLDDAPLSTQHRDLLWKAFGLPVFEQLRGWDGAVIARECEVHDGLHFDAETVVARLDGENLFVTGRATGLSAEIVRDQCECGVETPRLRQLSARAAKDDATEIARPVRELFPEKGAQAAVASENDENTGDGALRQMRLKSCVRLMIAVVAFIAGGEMLRRGQ